MGALSITHLLLLAIVILIIMGPRRLPELGNALGEAIRGFKKGISGNDPEPEVKSVAKSEAKSEFKSALPDASQALQQEAQIAQLKAQIELMRKEQLRIQSNNMSNIGSASQIHQVEFESAKPVEAQIQDTRVQKDSTI